MARPGASGAVGAAAAEGPAVNLLNTLTGRLAAEMAALASLDVSNLPLGHRSAAFTAFGALVALACAALAFRSLTGKRAGRNYLVVPAILGADHRSFLSFIRHAPLILFIAGVPLFMFALADPSTSLAETQVTYPGRRIALLIDASSSMLKPFGAGQLNARAPTQSAFFTSVGAAEAFIRLRQRGQYRDLIALIEFGDQAYVITPFTLDYDNVLLSTALIGDWSEFMRFPNQGTTIAAAIAEGTNLFKTFKFVDASGNLMIIFSDGEDTQVSLHGRPLADVLASAVATKIPVYLIRTNRDKALGDIVPDALWKEAVENTGGRFYAAADESGIIRAMDDIDRRSPGTIEVKQYSTNQPKFAPFALLAVGLWAVALVLKLACAPFTKLP
jgi:Ca-activated chloride channel family protein